MAEIFLTHVSYSVPVDPDFQHCMEFGNYNTRWGMVIATVALGIKLSKDWYSQQRQNLEMLKYSKRSQLALQKSRFHPQLLARSLNTIYNDIQSASGKAPRLILNLSDLLSYSLYESDAGLIPLKRELSELQNLLSLEKHNEESPTEIQASISGDVTGKYILPMIIVKIFEESIAVLQNSKSPPQRLSSRIIIVRNTLSLNLAFTGQYEDNSIAEKWLPLVADTARRLGEFYPKDDYDISFIPEQDGGVVRLKINLSDEPGASTINSVPKAIPSYYDHA